MLKSKLSCVLTIVLFLGIANDGLGQAQEVKKIKLSNGEEVVDISGEWDTLIENYGAYKEWGKAENVMKITMNGNAFVGVRMKASSWYPAGSESFRGELDKDGIKNLRLKAGGGTYIAQGQLSADGDKITMDDGKCLKLSLTRKK